MKRFVIRYDGINQNFNTEQKINTRWKSSFFIKLWVFEVALKVWTRNLNTSGKLCIFGMVQIFLGKHADMKRWRSCSDQRSTLKWVMRNFLLKLQLKILNLDILGLGLWYLISCDNNIIIKSWLLIIFLPDFYSSKVFC